MRTFLAAVLTIASVAVVEAAHAQPADPHLWLEDVTGEKALEWVRTQNAKYLPELEGTPGFAGWRSRAEEILQDRRRIALPTGANPSGVAGTQVFNFWRDASNLRGLWRVSPRVAFDAGLPQWTTLLDMDRLESTERANLQFAGANCLAPEWKRCLVSLSVGGKDAVEIREFNLQTRRFVQGGFRLPEAKQSVEWLDADHLLVASAAGPATTSGYAREVRLWQRGTAFSAATLLLSAAETDVGAGAAAYGQAKERRAVIRRQSTFWTARIHHVTADFSLLDSPLPADASFRFIADTGQGPRAFALLQKDFAGIPKGSLVSYAVPKVGPLGKVQLVFSPSQTQSIASVRATGRAVYVSLLDNVAAKLLRLQHSGEAWAQHEVPIASNTSVDLVAADEGDALYATVTGYTEPSRLIEVSSTRPPVTLVSAPAFFDGSRFEVSQRFAISKDGTQVPYFVVRPRGAKGPLKTLYWSYGGFRVPLRPAYPTPEVIQWLEAGNQYVVGNIRGGGEFGPRWHQAALLEKRQNSYDDLHAIAEALKREQTASSIAVHGRSNGGLMAAVAFTQRPDLYDAALVGVPLADMKRYHVLLAGASWMAEFGNPDTPDWDFIKTYSPYHNIRKEATYPRVFLYTSTKDDRVHPGHARKMAAEMQAQGHKIYYYENIDGGHAGVANLKENAYRSALMLAYLHRELK